MHRRFVIQRNFTTFGPDGRTRTSLLGVRDSFEEASKLVEQDAANASLVFDDPFHAQAPDLLQDFSPSPELSGTWLRSTDVSRHHGCATYWIHEFVQST